MSVQDDSFRTYALDGQDAIRDIEGSLLTLESEPENAAEINRLYRALHSLKGNSALLGLSNIETLSHAAEDMVGLARDHGVAVDGSMVDLMLRIVDCLRIVVERAGRQHLDAEASETAALVADVHGWIGARGGVRKVELGATRGEILIWSDIPAADVSSPTASRAEVICDEQDSSEFFVALVRELSPTLQGAVRAALGGQGVELDLLATCVSELSQPALRLGLFELVDCFGTLEHMVRERDGAGLRQQVATLADQLDTLERAANLSEFALAAPYHALLDGAASQQEPARAAGAAARPARDSARQRASRRPAEDKPRRSAEPEYLRIDAHKLSIVLDLAGEIALASGAVTHHPELAGLELEGFTAAAHKLEVLIRELQNEVSAMRLVPVSGVFQSMKRVVRDTARRTGKSVELSLVGEETEIDKVMVDSLHDPLVHLVRNAIDHGI